MNGYLQFALNAGPIVWGLLCVLAITVVVMNVVMDYVEWRARSSKHDEDDNT